MRVVQREAMGCDGVLRVAPPSLFRAKWNRGVLLLLF